MHGLAFGFNGLISLLLKIGLMGVGVSFFVGRFELGGGDETFLYQVDVE